MFPVSDVIDENSYQTVLPQCWKVVVKIYETPRTYELVEQDVFVTFDEDESLERVRQKKDSIDHTERLLIAIDLPLIQLYNEELALEIANSTAEYVVNYVEETQFTSKNDLYLDKTRELLTMLKSVTTDYRAYDRVFGRKL